MTYEQAKKRAKEQANELGFDYGVSKTYDGYTCFMLPAKLHRSGHELRCEVVSCDDIKKIRQGHGP